MPILRLGTCQFVKLWRDGQLTPPRRGRGGSDLEVSSSETDERGGEGEDGEGNHGVLVGVSAIEDVGEETYKERGLACVLYKGGRSEEIALA